MDTKLYLYNKGDLCSNITGGWTSRAVRMINNNNIEPKAPIITGDSESIHITSDNETSGLFTTSEKINLADYDTMTFIGEYFVPNTDAPFIHFGVWSSVGIEDYFTDGKYEKVYKSLLATPEGIPVSLDISKLNGSYYIGFGIYNWDEEGDPSVKIQSVYLTKKE